MSDAERWGVIRDIVAIVALAGAGTAPALTGHETSAGTVFGGLLALLVPASPRIPAGARAALVMVGAVAGGAILGGV